MYPNNIQPENDDPFENYMKQRASDADAIADIIYSLWGEYPDEQTYAPTITQQTSAAMIETATELADSICSFYKELHIPCTLTSTNHSSLLLVCPTESRPIRIHLFLNPKASILNLRFEVIHACESAYSIPLMEFINAINCPKNNDSVTGFFYFDSDVEKILYQYSFVYQPDAFDPEELDDIVQSCIAHISNYQQQLETIIKGALPDEERLEWLAKMKLFAANLYIHKR